MRLQAQVTIAPEGGGGQWGCRTTSTCCYHSADAGKGNYNKEEA